MDLKSDKSWWTLAGIAGAVALYAWWEGWSSSLMTIVEEISHAVGGTKQERAKQLAPYVESYRGAVPFGVCMAIAEHESSFNPAAWNNAGARGVWQIMTRFFGAGYAVDDSTAWLHSGGADLATVLDRSTAAACAALNRAHGDLERYAPQLCPAQAGTITDAYAGGIYYAHCEGRGNLQTALARAAAAGGVTLDGILSARTMYNRAGGVRQVAGLAAWWEDHRSEYLA
jgi:hypothetical protein